MKRHVSRKTVNCASRTFPVVVQEDVSGGYWVNCPALQGCYSQGDTVEDALRNIREAIALCLEESSAAEKRGLDRDVSLHFVRV